MDRNWSCGVGIRTGRCVDYKNPLNNETHSTCEVNSWCPEETPELPSNTRAIFEDSENLILTVRTYVKKGNDLKYDSSLVVEDPKHCQYSKEGNNSQCHNFLVGDIIRFAAPDYSFFEVARKGAQINIMIDWLCHTPLFRSEAHCSVSYEFHTTPKDVEKLSLQTDATKNAYNPNPTELYHWYRRNAHYSKLNEKGDYSRTMYKTYGINFNLIITGKATEWSLFNILQAMTVGGGFFYFVSLSFDFLANNGPCSSKRLRHQNYQNLIYETIDDDALQPPRSATSCTAVSRSTSTVEDGNNENIQKVEAIENQKDVGTNSAENA